MKLFAVYADVVLSYKPDWLDPFRARYDKPYPYHVTLKQTCYADDWQTDDIRQILSSFFGNLQIPDHAILLAFDRLVADEADGSIMIATAPNSLIHRLQKDLVHALRSYASYYEPASEAWEKNFQPHLTIARSLTPRLLRQAKLELRPDDLPRGMINEITLVVVPSPSPEEATRPENLTHYKF